MSTISKILIAVILVGAVIYAVLVFDIGRRLAVIDFTSCVAAGYPIMESYPRQCRDNDDNVYVEDVTQQFLDDMIQVSTPSPASEISSPVQVSGQARGPWYFEASFPVSVHNSEGVQIGIGVAQAETDWMTTEFVPFSGLIEFSASTTETGFLRFMKDNPSGMAEFDAHVDVPVRFSAQVTGSVPSQPLAACRPTGCSSQVCSDTDVVTTCEFREEFACYRSATCARQTNGQCGWTETPALVACLSDAR